MMDGHQAATVEEWLAGMWGDVGTVSIRSLRGGVHGGTAAVTVRDAEELARLGTYLTTGTYLNDITRSPATHQLELVDAGGALICTAQLYAPEVIAWERERFWNDLELRFAPLLWVFLAEKGMPGALARLLGPLMEKLDLYDTEDLYDTDLSPVALAARGIPEVLWTDIASLSLRDKMQFPDDAVDELHRKLAAWLPDDVARARTLMSWLGSTTWPIDATDGDGRLAMKLLERMPRSTILASLDQAGESATIMGGIAWVTLTGDETGVAERLAPGLVKLLGDAAQ